MKEKEITPQESLDIITSMIRETRHRISLPNLHISAMWGTVSIVTAAVAWITARLTGDSRSMFVWLAIPAIGIPLSWIMSRRDKTHEKSRTYIEKVVDDMWRAITGLGAALAAVCAVVHLLSTGAVWLVMFFYALIAVGAGAMVQGLLVGERCFVRGGWVSMLAGFALCGASFSHVMPKANVLIPIFIVCFAAMFLFPAYAVHRKLKHEQQ